MSGLIGSIYHLMTAKAKPLIKYFFHNHIYVINKYREYKIKIKIF